MHSKFSRQNPHFAKYERWRGKIATRVTAKHGGMAKLARAIGVSKQTVHRWFRGHAEIPAWAAFAVVAWWQVHHAQYPATLYSLEERPPGE
jgi:hypothetical protein